MKKRLIIIISSVVVVLAAAGIILGVSLSNRPTPPTPPGPNEPTEQLFVPRGLELNGTVLSWDGVENATEYVVKVGDTEYTTSECSIDLKDKAKERDILSVKAKAEGFITSKKSIDKIYISVINQEEVKGMSNKVLEFVAEKSGGTVDEITEMFGDALNTISEKLYKEGLVTKDIENVVTTVDDVITSIENFEPSDDAKVSEYVEVITNQVSKLVDLEISTYAVTLAIKEVCLFAIEVNTDGAVSGKKNLVRVDTEIYPNEEVYVQKLYDYLEKMSNRDIERIAFVLDSLKEVYIALEVKLPNIFDEIDKIETNWEGVENWDNIFALVESAMKIKDDVINSVLAGMPTMEEFTEVASIFASIYDAIAPEYINDSNPYEMCLRAYQEMYALLHRTISFIGEIDTELFLQIKPYIKDVCTIIEEDFYALMEFDQKHPGYNFVGALVYIALEEHGLKEEEIEEYMSNVENFVEVISENPKEILEVLMEKSNEVLADELKNADFSVITKDPLIQKIIYIMNSDDVEAELIKFLEKDVKIHSFMSFKEGKTINDLVDALMKVKLEDIISFFETHTDGFTSSEFISALGLDKVVIVNIEGMFAAIIKIADVKTISLLNDLIKIDSVDKLEKVLDEYFNISIDLEATFKELIEAVLDYYGVNLEFKEVIDSLIKAAGLDKVYEALENVYKILEEKANKFNEEYVSLVPYEEMPSEEEILDYLIKNLTYSIFGENSENAVKDLNTIYNALKKLVEENELVSIVDRIVDEFSKFEFDITKYLTDNTYEASVNQNIINITSTLLTEYTNTYNYIMSLEEDLTNVAIKVENFISKYFEGEVEISNEIKYLFEELQMFELPKAVKNNIEKEIKSFVNNNLKTLVTEIIDMMDNIVLLGDDIYTNYLMNEERINELAGYILSCIEITINDCGLNPFDQIVGVAKPLPPYYEQVDPKQYLYELAGEEIKEFVGLLENIITINNEELIEDLNKNIANIYNIIGLELDYNFTDLYNDLCALLDELANYNEINITEPAVIEYWHANSSALTVVLEEIVASFEEQYPQYEVELYSFGDYTTLRDSIVGAIVYGDAPTAAQTYPDHIPVYLQVDALASLDEYINDPVYGISYEEQLEFIEGFWNEGTVYDEYGTRYAMPFNKSTEVMYYNTDIFEKYGWEVPRTWDEVIEICEAWKLTDEYKKVVAEYGAGQVYGLGYDSQANLAITLTQQYGATFTSFDENGKGIFNAFGAVEEDTLKSKEAMNWYCNQFKNGNVSTATAFGTDYCSNAFKNGQCIMIIGSSAGATYNDGQYSYRNKFVTGVTAVPQKDLENGQVIQQGTNVSLFKCNDKVEEFAGWLWLKHMVSYESALTWALKTAYFPIRKDVLNSFEYQNHIIGNIILADGTVINGIQSLAAKAKQAGLLQQDWFYTNIAFMGSSRARDNAEILVELMMYGDYSADQAYDYIKDILYW